MKQEKTNSPAKGRTGSERERVRKPVLVVVSFVVLATVSLLIADWKRGRPESTAQPADAANDNTPIQSSGGQRDPRWPATKSSFHRVQTQEAVPPDPIDPTVSARQLVKTLSEVTLQGEITPEKAEKWRHGVEQLIEHGTAAIPAVQEFLQRNENVRFDSGPGTNRLGDPTLRIALIKVLFDIPAPDNVNLEAQVLRATKDPDEIALLARQLDLQEPGKYRDLIVPTVTAALDRAKSEGRDTRALLEVLKRFEK